ncbi:hypothetical protein P7C70_g7332, partial [Phenoliferia sp. Uapishka_3]
PDTATESDASLPSTPRQPTPLVLSPPRIPKPNSALTAPPLLSLPSVLLSLDLDPFQGRLHSGLCDTRNAARVLIELARRGQTLTANRNVPEGGSGSRSREKYWGWMGKDGQVHWDAFLKTFGVDKLPG